MKKYYLFLVFLIIISCSGKDKDKATQIDSGTLFQVFYTPNSSTISKITQFIDNATSDLGVAAYDIRNSDIANSIVNAKNRGLNVKVVVDASGYLDGNSKISGILLNGGVSVKKANVYIGKLYQTFIVSRGTDLLTGNITFADDASKNSGNILIMQASPKLVQNYSDQLNKLWLEGQSF